MSKSNKMNPAFLFLSENSNFVFMAMLYDFRKKFSLSDKALFILMYVIDGNLENKLIEATTIAEALGEDNRSNLWKAIKMLEDAKIVTKSKTERIGSRNVRKILVSKSSVAIKEFYKIIEICK